ncbi:MAG TPA: hypothetical protein VGM93_09825, partial [Acidimicrobiales bacterium]
MSGELRTDDGKPIAGWVLRADPAVFDVDAMISEYGQVYRFPVAAGPRAHLMDAGQPCFLFAGAGGGRGIYAVGEVVAPTTTITLDGTLPDGTVEEEVQLYAEVELLPIEPPMRVAEMESHRVLSKGELLTNPGQDNPIVLRPEEVRALEEFEFFVIEPTDDQVARLQDVLADDGPIFQLAGVDRTFG